MLTQDQKQLQIFEDFIIDRSLPKYQKDSQESLSSGINTFSLGNSIDPPISGNSRQPSFLQRLLHRPAPPPKQPKPQISVMEFFKSIKNTSKELAKIEKRIDGYVTALEHATLLGQTALKEMLEKQIDVVRAETQLYACGFKTIVEEAQIVEFYKKSERGIRLDYIKNFTKVIPSKFLEIKRQLDERHVFDNYAILHYDPNEKGYALTEKELEEKKAKERDPILFGLIVGSRKLYYIGDWVDDYCDLTLETLIDQFGNDAIKKNDLKSVVKINI